MSFLPNLSKIIDHLKGQFANLQTGVANAALVEPVIVEAYGSSSPLKSLANISCPDNKTLKIEPWDKALIGDIEKGIQGANIGLNPQNMGDHLFIPIPPMTEDRRRDIVKLLREYTEQARISARNSRHEAMKKIKQQKNDGEISEDQQRDYEKEVQKSIDDINQEIEALSKKKEAEIMSV